MSNDWGPSLIEALGRLERYINRIAELDPIIETTDGMRCIFGCGYGTWDGAETADDAFSHRNGCLWKVAPAIRDLALQKRLQLGPTQRSENL